MRTMKDYEGPAVGASLSQLLELSAALRDYRRGLILVGGWVPYLLLRDHQPKGDPFVHPGSIDIDFAVDPDKVGEPDYASIAGRLLDLGFERSPQSQFSFERPVPVVGSMSAIKVAVDFLGPPSAEGSRRGRRHGLIQGDLVVRNSPAARVAIAHSVERVLDGRLPNGASHRAKILICDVVACVATKGLALGGRYKEKDAFDLYSVLAHYKAGPDAVADEVGPFRAEPEVAEALGHLADWFDRLDGKGPKAIADFHYFESGEARSRRERDAYEVVGRFLKRLGK